MRAEYEQKLREHQAAAAPGQRVPDALTAAIGERGRLVALHRAAEQQCRKAARQAEAARGKLSGAVADHARAEGELAAPVNAAPTACAQCGQVLPEREPGLCQQCGQCGQAHAGAENQRERQIATTHARVERLRLTLQDAAARTSEAAQQDEEAAAAALAARDVYDQEHLAPARTAAQQAEKDTHGLSRDISQLKRRLEDAGYISAQKKGVKAAQQEMEAAQAARDAAKTTHGVRRKEATGRWSEFFLARLRQITPGVETASTGPQDFTTRVKERDEVDKTFAENSVAGSPKAATNTTPSFPPSLTHCVLPPTERFRGL
ncbi:hypothetical protein ACWGJ2_33080 [Streptomyces sp. NPDC054796]